MLSVCDSLAWSNTCSHAVQFLFSNDAGLQKYTFDFKYLDIQKPQRLIEHGVFAYIGLKRTRPTILKKHFPQQHFLTLYNTSSVWWYENVSIREIFKFSRFF